MGNVSVLEMNHDFHWIDHQREGNVPRLEMYRRNMQAQDLPQGVKVVEQRHSSDVPVSHRLARFVADNTALRKSEKTGRYFCQHCNGVASGNSASISNVVHTTGCLYLLAQRILKG